MKKQDPGGDAARDLPRIRTGNAQLDAILHGGLPANSINVLMGEPGSGKTILAERLIFENADPKGRPILFLTTLSEPLEKVVRYLQQFEFYDEEAIASGAVVYESLGPELRDNGIGALIPKLKEAITTLGPKIIVIDSFKAIHDLSTSVPEMRRMLYEMSGLLTAYDTTAILVGEYSQAMIPRLPEFAVADAMIELAREKQGTRDERFLRVLKLRGSDYQQGLHAFRITADGLEVFPRLTSPHAPPEYIAREDVRVTTGIVGLDALLGGGVLAGSTTLVQGSTGSGKTTVALQFILEGLKRGEPGIYVNFQENPAQLARAIQGLGWTMADATAKGLHCIYTSPVELQIDSILVDLFDVFRDKEIKRVAVDAVGDLVNGASDVQRVLGYLYALGQHFQVRRAASLMTLETSTVGESSLAGQVSAMSDTILELDVERNHSTARRTLRVVKSRGTSHDLMTHELRISSAGAEVI